MLMCSEDVQNVGFLEKEMFFPQKYLKFFKNAKQRYFSLECFSKSTIAHENWKRSRAWDFRESGWVISKNCLIFLKMADISNIFIECVSNGIFAQISQNFETLVFLGKRNGVFRIKKLEFFCQNWLISQVWCTIWVKLCFCSRILKTFRFWLLSENPLDFFKNAKNQKKILESVSNCINA